MSLSVPATAAAAGENHLYPETSHCHPFSTAAKCWHSFQAGKAKKISIKICVQNNIQQQTERISLNKTNIDWWLWSFLAAEIPIQGGGGGQLFRKILIDNGRCCLFQMWPKLKFQYREGEGRDKYWDGERISDSWHHMWFRSPGGGGFVKC